MLHTLQLASVKSAPARPCQTNTRRTVPNIQVGFLVTIIKFDCTASSQFSAGWLAVGLAERGGGREGRAAGRRLGGDVSRLTGTGVRLRCSAARCWTYGCHHGGMDGSLAGFVWPVGVGTFWLAPANCSSESAVTLIPVTGAGKKKDP